MAGIGKKSIHQWTEDARPREKMMKYGADSLTNAELLAILIGSGTREEDAVSLMQRILDDHCNNLDDFCRLDYDDLIQYKGIGMAKAVTLLAANQLAKRRTMATNSHTICDNPQAIYDLLADKMRDLTTESCYVLVLDQRLRYKGDKMIASGGYTFSAVDPRVILKYARTKNAVALAIAHNHPSGSLIPSTEDDRLTQKVAAACNAVGIRFIDHLIITAHGFYSYQDHGKI